MAEEQEIHLPQIVQQITDSLSSAIPQIVLRLKAMADQNAVPQPELLRSIEGVAKAGDSLAATCTDIANVEYEDYPEIKEELLSSSGLVTKSSIKLRRATLTLNQKREGDRAPCYQDVMEAATAIAAACVHVLEVVYGCCLRRCALVQEDAYTAFEKNSDAAANALRDAQHYADIIGELCSKANLVAGALYSLSENERDAAAGAKLNAMGTRVEQASQALLDACNDYLGDLGNESKRAAAQAAQDELLKVLKEAGALIAARKAELDNAPKQKEVEVVIPPSRASLASQIPDIQTPLDYLMFVAEQKRQCDLVDDYVVTAKNEMRQAMVENGRAIVKRHAILTQEAERLCESDMARAAVNDTAEKSDTAIRAFIKNGSQTLDNPKDEEMKKTLVASASAYKVLLMKYSDDIVLRPDEGRVLTACQKLRVAITEGHASEDILSLLEEAVGEYNYRVERVQNESVKVELFEDVRIIEADVRKFAAKKGIDADEERDAALDSMDDFENTIIAYLLSLVQQALAETGKLYSFVNAKDNAGIDASNTVALKSITEVITESRSVSEEYTGCVEGTQDEFEAAAKRVEKAMPEMIKASREVKAGRVDPKDTVSQQKELDASLHHVEELCKRARYKRVPKKHQPPKEEKKPEPESVIVERKKTEEKVEKVEKTEKSETSVEKKEEGGMNTNMILMIIIIVLLIVILFKIF